MTLFWMFPVKGRGTSIIRLLYPYCNKLSQTDTAESASITICNVSSIFIKENFREGLYGDHYFPLLIFQNHIYHPPVSKEHQKLNQKLNTMIHKTIMLRTKKLAHLSSVYDDALAETISNTVISDIDC